jgi:hypothetical protein
VDDQRGSRIAPQIGHPATISVSVDPQMVLAEQVVDDDLARRAVAADRREHRAAWRTQESANRLDQIAAISHAKQG